MKFGISVSQINEVDLVVQAEKVGYDFCWVWDSPMIRSNLWVLLALVADRTNRIAVGPGVAIPALSMAPVTANAIATINAIAPGRTFLGVGTGNTAMRAMGQVPMSIAAFERVSTTPNEPAREGTQGVRDPSAGHSRAALG